MGETARQEPPEPKASEDNRVHVYPLFGPGHVIDGGIACWCEPKIEHVEGGGMVVVHRVWN